MIRKEITHSKSKTKIKYMEQKKIIESCKEKYTNLI